MLLENFVVESNVIFVLESIVYVLIIVFIGFGGVGRIARADSIKDLRKEANKMSAMALAHYLREHYMYNANWVDVKEQSYQEAMRYCLRQAHAFRKGEPNDIDAGVIVPNDFFYRWVVRPVEVLVMCAMLLTVSNMETSFENRAEWWKDRPAILQLEDHKSIFDEDEREIVNMLSIARPVFARCWYVEAKPIAKIHTNYLFLNEKSRTAYLIAHGGYDGKLEDCFNLQTVLVSEEEQEQPHLVGVREVMNLFHMTEVCDSGQYDRIVVVCCYPGRQKGGEIKVGDKTVKVEYFSTDCDAVNTANPFRGYYKDGFRIAGCRPCVTMDLKEQDSIRIENGYEDWEDAQKLAKAYRKYENK